MNKPIDNFVSCHEMRRIETKLRQLTATDYPFIRGQVDYVLAGGGKRIRPVLSLLAGACAGVDRNTCATVGAIMEIVHTATLVHDDVIDKADRRRNQPTLNHLHPANIAVLIGDFLFSRTVDSGLKLDNHRFLQELARVSTGIFEGEVEQSMGAYHVLDRAAYLRIIRKKTGLLFGFALAAPLLFSRPRYRAAYSRWFAAGVDMGIGFQLIDDVLDFNGKPKLMGKPPLQDINSGRLTMPVILALAAAPPARRAEAIRLYLRRGSYPRLLRLIRESNGIELTRALAEKYIRNAVDNLTGLPDSKNRKKLGVFIESLSRRCR